MNHNSTFAEVLDAVDHLPPEEQSELIEVIGKRLAEQGRRQITADANEARADFQNNQTAPTSVDDLMREIES